MEVRLGMSTRALVGVQLICLAVFYYLASIESWYSSIPHSDKLIHLFGGYVLAMATSEVAKAKLTLLSFERDIVSFAAVLVVGVLWEFLEYFTHGAPFEFLFRHSVMIQDSLEESLVDLCFDMLGWHIFVVSSRNK